MHTFSWKMQAFSQKCKKMQENTCTFSGKCKKMRAFSWKMQENAHIFTENALK